MLEPQSGRGTIPLDDVVEVLLVDVEPCEVEAVEAVCVVEDVRTVLVSVVVDEVE